MYNISFLSFKEHLISDIIIFIQNMGVLDVFVYVCVAVA